jgi:DNA-directed RNA polymerase subunit K/omega
VKETKAAFTTKTFDKNVLDQKTSNIYEALSIVAKRSVQINAEIKKELVDKLEEFATYTDSLEEVFENKEQIEVSKFYEKMPKPHAMAIEEWLNDRIYYRNTLTEE